MARSISTMDLACLRSLTPQKHLDRVVVHLQSLKISKSRPTYRLLMTCGLQNGGEPAKKDNANMVKWIAGSIVWLALPSWKKIQSVENIVKNIDGVVEDVEYVADTAEKMANEVANKLPDGGDMKKVVLDVKSACQEIERDAKLLDSLIHKFSTHIKVEGLNAKLLKTIDEPVPEQQKSIDEKHK